MRRIALASVLCCALTPSFALGQEERLDMRLNEQILMIPDRMQTALETTVFRPAGVGPFPLLIINHGKQLGNPQLQKRARFIYMATAFVRRGYAVMVPMRAGFAHSTGKYANHGCDMTANGYAQADDVLDVIAYARRQGWIDPDRIIVAGQSYGGLATMALATQAIPGVKGVLNFAGGLRSDGGHCDWQTALIKAFASYGARNKIPSVWMYGANDSYFSPELVASMHGAFMDAGGQAKLLAYGAFKRDAHGMLASKDGEKIWWPETERFLSKIGMPTAEIQGIEPPQLPLKTNFAAINDVGAIPFLSDRGRDGYRIFLEKVAPRAFALSASGAWGWAEDGDDPDDRALVACQKRSRQPCRLYSVDENVVWQGAMATGGAE